MIIVQDVILLDELDKMAGKIFGNFVKAVVDVELEIMALDGELHSDLESLLLDQGSKQKDLWGINLYPKLAGNDFVEFDSMINIRPAQGNKIRGIQDENLQKRIIEIVEKRIKR